MKLAAIRIRGCNRVNQTIERTLNQLHLYRKNFCVVIDDTPSYRGMLSKVKDYITYGPIDDTTYKTLVDKRGEEFIQPVTDKNKLITYETRYVAIGEKKYKPFFRLHPPRGGFDRKGTKKAFSLGGALGYRGEEIRKLLARMV
ncbi:50S ribosomal protein L30 [Candidatus Woesearchaeota archaeon]|nr:50S ribosomal protein L30 [Candidatus Woesearchaeota archaeon]